MMRKMKEQRNSWGIATILGLALLVFSACADPAADKPKAGVSNSTNAPETAAPRNAEKIAITPANSKIEFTGSTPKESRNGSFKQFSGQVDLAEGKPEASKVTLEIDTTSLEADDPKLTEHLKTADFFDVAKFPKATFVSTEIKPGGENGATHTVTGNLDLHGVKKAVTFPATIKVAPDSVSMNSEFAFNRRDFGINYTGPTNNLIRDNVVLRLSVNTPRSAAAK
jgi:polyisoprenoid-binding protein YceI